MKNATIVSFYSLLLHTTIIFTMQAHEQGASSILYAPWRETYLTQIDTPALKDDACPFCRAIQNPNSSTDFVLRIFEHTIVMLNAYPYSKGHVLIIPLVHKPHLKDLTPATRSEMMELANITLEIIERLYGATAGNVGINIGKIAGAGIPDHLHLHIVPRLLIPSFMSVIGHTEVVGFNMNQVYAEMKAEFDKIELP